jgi:hypothetical protein
MKRTHFLVELKKKDTELSMMIKNHYKIGTMVKGYYRPKDTESGEVYQEDELIEEGIDRNECIESLVFYPYIDSQSAQVRALKIKDVIIQLEQMSQNMMMILSKDPYGIEYSPVSTIEEENKQVTLA